MRRVREKGFFGRRLFSAAEIAGVDDAVNRVEGLYNAHGQALLGYLRRSFGHAEAAEDLLHETFLQALRGLDRLTAAASPRAWLFGIARRVGLAALRRRRMQPLPDGLAAAEAGQADERLERMRRAIGRLPPPQREALQLRLVEELSYEEIAAVLEIPVGTVRSRLHNAVRMLGGLVARDMGDARQ
jgi:RNA polymerase sigma factor (sigma-70 family)